MEDLLLEPRFEAVRLRKRTLFQRARHRAADRPLHLLATDAAQEVSLLFSLNAFSGRVDTECLGHEQDGCQQLPCRLCKIIEEDAIETDLIDGAALQCSKRGMALAEVVERDAVAFLTQT